MKLVEILAKELEEWPPHAFVAVQDDDDDHTIWFLQSDHRDLSFMPGGWKCESPFDILISRPSQLAHDHATAIVTRADWEKEKMKQAAPKKNAEGWIRHRGGKCPVEAGVKVDYRMRNNRQGCGERAELLDWGRDEECPASNIMAYRLHKPAKQVEACSKPELQIMLPDGYCEIYNAQAIPQGPLQWRDRIAEIDVDIKFEEDRYNANMACMNKERAELVKKLASEGFALIGLVVEPVEDMSDWRNWKTGDLIEMVNQKHWADMTDGKTYALTKAGSRGFSFVDDIGDMREAFERTANDYAKDFKWHSRPSA